MVRFLIVVIAVVGLAACQQEDSSPKTQQPAAAKVEKQSQLQVAEKSKPEPVVKADTVVEKVVEEMAASSAPVGTKKSAVKEAAVVNKSVDVPAVKSEAKATSQPVVEQQPAVVKEAVVAPEPAMVAKGDAQRGAKLSRKCAACHTFDQGGKNKTGPNLFGIYGSTKGSAAGFRYGEYLQAQHAAKAVWNEAELKAWVENSKGVAKAAGSSTKMPAQKIAGDKADDLIAYLKTLK